MRRTCWLSVDYDFFVRSLGIWDWSHKESPFFRSGFIWQTRVAPFIMQGLDIREEMSPAKHARPLPSSFWSVLEQLGYDFTDTDFYVVADSHSGAGPIFNQMADELFGEPADVLVNFDAHHDLGYCDWARIQELADQETCTCDMWLCALMQWWEDFETRIVFPDWMREDSSIQEQVRHVRDLLPRELWRRVKMDFFTTDEGTISPVVIEPGEELDVQAVFVCRSGAWVPPWLDQDFVDFVMAGHEVIGQLPLDPFRESDVSALEIRTDFDYDEAVKMGEQWKQAMKEGGSKIVFRDDED
jgi:hypothetical protein